MQKLPIIEFIFEKFFILKYFYYICCRFQNNNMKKFLQKIANLIVEKIKNSKTKNEAELWFNIGMSINQWLVKRNIWLD